MENPDFINARKIIAASTPGATKSTAIDMLQLDAISKVMASDLLNMDIKSISTENFGDQVRKYTDNFKAYNGVYDDKTLAVFTPVKEKNSPSLGHAAAFVLEVQSMMRRGKIVPALDPNSPSAPYLGAMGNIKGEMRLASDVADKLRLVSETPHENSAWILKYQTADNTWVPLMLNTPVGTEPFRIEKPIDEFSSGYQNVLNKLGKFITGKPFSERTQPVVPRFRMNILGTGEPSKL